MILSFCYHGNNTVQVQLIPHPGLGWYELWTGLYIQATWCYFFFLFFFNTVVHTQQTRRCCVFTCLLLWLPLIILHSYHFTMPFHFSFLRWSDKSLTMLLTHSEEWIRLAVVFSNRQVVWEILHKTLVSIITLRNPNQEQHCFFSFSFF